MPIGPSGERLPYPGEGGAPPPQGGPPQGGPPMGGPPPQQQGEEVEQLVAVFDQMGGDINRPEDSPEIIQQLAEQTGLPPQQLLEILVSFREQQPGVDDDAFTTQYGRSKDSMRRKMGPGQAGPQDTPPQMGPPPQTLDAPGYGGGGYRPRRK